jgi:hypothetical protein
MKLHTMAGVFWSPLSAEMLAPASNRYATISPYLRGPGGERERERGRGREEKRAQEIEKEGKRERVRERVREREKERRKKGEGVRGDEGVRGSVRERKGASARTR